MNELANNSGVLDDIRKIIEHGRRQAYAAANQTIVLTYWHIGRRIVEEEQQGEERAQYGKLKHWLSSWCQNMEIHLINVIWTISVSSICVSKI